MVSLYRSTVSSFFVCPAIAPVALLSGGLSDGGLGGLSNGGLSDGGLSDRGCTF
jgi:hypothetical protein